MQPVNKRFTESEVNPLSSLDQWEDDVLERYPDPESIATAKSTTEYRNYETPARDSVKEFYRLNHTYQTFDFVKQFLTFFHLFHVPISSTWNSQRLGIKCSCCQN